MIFCARAVKAQTASSSEFEASLLKSYLRVLMST